MPALIASLRRAFDTRGRRPALQGEQWQLDYRDLDHDSAALAAELVRLGVRPGDRVALAAPRSPQMVVAMVALLRCGAAWAPLDLANPPERIEAMLDVLASPLILTGPGARLAQRHAARGIDLQALLASAATPAAAPPWPDAGGDPRDDAEAVACVMFTSGSTGAPKAVAIPRRAIARLVVDTGYAEFGPDARWAHAASPAFDASLLEVWGPLLNGACCVVQERPLPGLHELAGFLVERRISDAWLTAALFNTLVDEQLDALGGLRQLLTGGETMSTAHARACLARWPALRLVNGYGPTENTTFSLTHRIEAGDVTGGAAAPIGRPIAGTRVRIEPAEPADATRGELWVGGDGLALGYVGNPDETARRFVVDADGLAWYRTGDAVSQRADGVFLFHGRLDRQVKLRGHRVDLDALEQLLAAAPGVLEAAVMVVGDAADERRLVACIGVGGGGGNGHDVRGGVGQDDGADAGLVGARANPSATPAAWRDWLAPRVAPAALPAQWIVRARLPQNASGKLDRAVLRAWADTPGAQRADRTDCTDGTDIADGPHAPGSSAAPATPTETALIALWSRQFPASAPHRSSDYRACGGHSLSALRLAADIRRELGRQVDALDLLRTPRLDAQARLVDAAPPAGARAAAAPDAVQLSAEQLAVLQADALDATGVAYLVHCAWAIAPGLSTTRLRAAIDALVERHPALRLAWRRDAGGDIDQLEARTLARAPADLVRRHPALPIGSTDAASASRWPAGVLATLRGPLAGEGPLRADLWPLADGGLLCALTLHHVVIDAWSLERVRIEIDAWLRGELLEPAPVPSDPTPVDQAGLQAQAAALARAWATHRPARLTADAVAPGAGGDVALELPDDLGTAARALARRAALAPFTPLLVAWGLALQAVFGDASRQVVVPFARRLGPDADRAIGYHLDLRLVDAGAAPGESVARLLQRVNAELLQAQRPWRRPLAQLADALSASDPTLRGLVTQFSFTWQPDRPTAFRLGGVAARDATVPLAGARFGLALHLETAAGAPQKLVARIEALQPLFDDGRALAAGRAFETALRSLCARAPDEGASATRSSEDGGAARRSSSSIAPAAGFASLVESAAAPESGCTSTSTSTSWSTPESESGLSPDESSDPAASATMRRAAAAAWSAVLGAPPTGADDDFLLRGGSSLLATRLAARLRRAVGRDLDLAAFLAAPRFGALCAGLARAPAGRPRAVLRLGHANARRVVLLIPGGAGGPLGLYALATALRERLPPDWALAIADLGALMRDAPEAPTGDWFAARLQQIARDLDASRLAGIVGFSLGGLMAMDVAAALAPDAPPLCLLDTYAPAAMRLDAPARFARLAIQAWRDPAATVARLRERRAPPQPGSVEADPQFPRWVRLMGEMALRPAPALRSRVTLVRSRTSSAESGLVRRLATNGFDPGTFRALDLQLLPYDHLGLVRDGADAVAAIVARAFDEAVPPDGSTT